MDNTETSRKFFIETLKEEMNKVVSEKHEFENRDQFISQTIRNLWSIKNPMQKKIDCFFGQYFLKSNVFLAAIFVEEVEPGEKRY